MSEKPSNLPSSNLGLSNASSLVSALPQPNYVPSTTDIIISGGIAGMVSLLGVQPLDFIRTRVQTNRQYTGSLDVIKQVLSKEGPLAFYKGMAAPLLAQGMYKAVMFTTFNKSKEYVTKYKQQYDLGSFNILNLALCGSFAGVCNSLVVTPVEYIRNNIIISQQQQQQQQQQIGGQIRNNHKIGPISILRSVLSSEQGIRRLWTGLQSTMIRDGLGVGGYFTANTLVAKYLADNTSISPGWRTVIAGAMAGVGFWSLALPFDRVKSMIQTSTNTSPKMNTLSVIKTIIQQEGIKGLYRGWNVGFTRGIPAATITFLVYDKVLQAIMPITQSKKSIEYQ